MKCYKGFYLQNKACKQANPLCKTFYKENGFCSSCFPGYTLLDGNCEKGGERDPQCKQFSSSNSNFCKICYKGYLAINGACKEQNPL